MGAILLAMVLLFSKAAIDLLRPWPMKFIFDNVLTPSIIEQGTLTGDATRVLILVAIGTISLAALDGLVSFLQALFVNRAGRMIVFDMRSIMFDHVQRLSLQYHSRRETGDLLQRVTSDVRALKEIFTGSLVEIAHSIAFFIGMAVVILWMDWQIAGVAMLAAPVLLLLVFLNNRNIRHYARIERRSEGRLSTVLNESLGAVRLVRVFNQEDEVRDRFRQQSAISADSGYEANLSGARMSWLIEVLRAVVGAGILAFGVMRVTHGAMSIGDMIVLTSYIRSFYRPMRTAMKEMNKVSQSMARAERVVDLLDTKEGVSDLPGASIAPRFAGKVTFENTTFGYEGKELVLKGIDLTIEAGSTTAIVGPTGVGKTTLISLIPRLYDPSSGAVLIDDTDIREFTLKSLRAQISVVLQESVLLRASIAENIAYGRANATLSQIIDAAKQANAHDFIMALPDGYETVVGERGETLSGGQRQRVAIARAMIRDAPILILDEPLVGLDGASADVVMDALERLTAGRTSIVISHLVSPIRRADRVVVLADGKVARHGSLAEMIALERHESDFVHTRLIPALPDAASGA
jgi:ATP-binding cassette subfamily B protein